jgi:hypothetical protein
MATLSNNKPKGEKTVISVTISFEDETQERKNTVVVAVLNT